MASHSTQVPALTSDQQSLAESEKSKSVVSQESSTVDVKKQNLAEFAPAPARLADIFLPRSKRAVGEFPFEARRSKELQLTRLEFSLSLALSQSTWMRSLLNLPSLMIQ